MPLDGQFHPKGKAPPEHARRVVDDAKETLPFEDTRDLDEQAGGLIAERPEMQIMADAGNAAFDMSKYQFLNGTVDFDSIHLSLTRIARLNNNSGLYNVIPGIYQVRGFDLSDIALVLGKTGWIVLDPLTTTETSRAAWGLFQDHVGDGLPIKAVIYSHTYRDHWGGVRDIRTDDDVRSGRIAGPDRADPFRVGADRRDLGRRTAGVLPEHADPFAGDTGAAIPE